MTLVLTGPTTDPTLPPISAEDLAADINNELVTYWLPLAGGNMTGPTTIHIDYSIPPTTSNEVIRPFSITADYAPSVYLNATGPGWPGLIGESLVPHGSSPAGLYPACLYLAGRDMGKTVWDVEIGNHWAGETEGSNDGRNLTACPFNDDGTPQEIMFRLDRHRNGWIDGAWSIGNPATTKNSLTITPGATAGSPIVFSNNGTGPVVFQITTTKDPLTITGNTTLPSFEAHSATAVRLIGETGNDAVIVCDTFGNDHLGGGGFFMARNANGSPNAPTSTIIGKRLSGFRAAGFGTTGYVRFESAAINMYAAEAFTDTAAGAFINFETVKVGTMTVPVERMRVTDAGAVTIGTPGTSNQLTITPGATTADPVMFTTSGGTGTTVEYGKVATFVSPGPPAMSAPQTTGLTVTNTNFNSNWQIENPAIRVITADGAGLDLNGTGDNWSTIRFNTKSSPATAASIQATRDGVGVWEMLLASPHNPPWFTVQRNDPATSLRIDTPIEIHGDGAVNFGSSVPGTSTTIRSPTTTFGVSPNNMLTITPGVTTVDPVALTQTGTGSLSISVPAIRPLFVTANTTLPTNIGLDDVLHVVGNTGANARLHIDAYGGAAITTFRTAEGSPGGLVATAAARNIFQIVGAGWDTTNYFPGILIRGVSTETWSSTAHGAYLTFSTVASGTTTLMERMRITDAGATQFGLPGTSNLLTITPGASAASAITFTNSGGGGITFNTTGGGTFNINPQTVIGVLFTNTAIALTPGATYGVNPASIDVPGSAGLKITPIVGFNNANPIAKPTGWGAPTGTATKTTYDTTTVTLSQLAERVKALIDNLTSYGLIGP